MTAALSRVRLTRDLNVAGPNGLPWSGRAGEVRDVDAAEAAALVAADCAEYTEQFAVAPVAERAVTRRPRRAKE